MGKELTDAIKHAVVHVAREAPKVIEHVVKEIQERREAENKQILENVEGYKQEQRDRIKEVENSPHDSTPLGFPTHAEWVRADANSKIKRADRLERERKEGKR